MTIISHPDTRQLLESLASDMPQSLLLSGRKGTGLLTIARWLARTRLAIEVHPQDAKENVNSQSGTISVETIRRLYDQTRAKHDELLVVIVDDADRMSHGAQAAFLKLLEEPNKHTHFILTSHSPQQLLSTIRSRTQHTIIRAVTTQQSNEFIVSLGIQEPTKQTQLQFIAEGLPAELARLVASESYFKDQAAAMTQARDFLQGTVYEKLVTIQRCKSNRDEALSLIESMLQILRRSLSAKPQPAIISQLEQLLEIQSNVANNHNINLQLAQFVL